MNAHVATGRIDICLYINRRVYFLNILSYFVLIF